MVAALKKNGVPLWYVVGTNEGHGFAKKVNQDYLQAVEVLFLERYLIGDGQPKPDHARKRYPVSGVVTLNGKPLESGTITLHPLDAAGSQAVATIENGAYTLTTRVPGDGALPGEYVVTIELKDPPAVGLPRRYSNQKTSPLRCEIRTPKNIIDFNIGN